MGPLCDEIVTFPLERVSSIVRAMKCLTALLSIILLVPIASFGADSGSPSADYLKGRDYLNGAGVEKNPQLAFSLFEKAAKAGDIEAKSGLGYLYFTGTGTPKDEAKGMALLEEAANAGSGKAAYNLAQIFIKKAPDSSPQALEFLAKATQAGMPEAKVTLADWYYFGRPGIPVDLKKAFDLYLEAAEDGNPIAENAVGAMYFSGKAVPLDRKKGIQYYRKAAEKGFARAEANLGQLYATGIEVGRNNVEALKWFFRANVQGDAMARVSLRDFLKGVTEAEIEQAIAETRLDLKAALNCADIPPSADSR